MQIGGGGDEPVTEINVTPLVDVCLVLVIIFMVTAPLLQHPSLPIKLPKAHTQEGEEKSNVTISISHDNQWAVNDKEYPVDRIPDILPGQIRRTSDKIVIIRADQEALHGALIQAMRIAKAAGAKTIRIATQPIK